MCFVAEVRFHVLYTGCSKALILILRITFHYTEVVKSEAQLYQAASTFSSLRPPMPEGGLQILLQKMAVGLRSVNPLATRKLAPIGTYF